jgi:hypothetical protein
MRDVAVELSVGGESGVVDVVDVRAADRISAGVGALPLPRASS